MYYIMPQGRRLRVHLERIRHARLPLVRLVHLACTTAIWHVWIHASSGWQAMACATGHLRSAATVLKGNLCLHKA